MNPNLVRNHIFHSISHQSLNVTIIFMVMAKGVYAMRGQREDKVSRQITASRGNVNNSNGYDYLK